jgi:hypothetical protein
MKTTYPSDLTEHYAERQRLGRNPHLSAAIMNALNYLGFVHLSCILILLRQDV